MGLDWCVRDRVVDGQETNYMFSKTQIDRINTDINKAFKEYADESGVEIPHFYPNEVYDKFTSTERYITLQANLRAWEATYEECVISPMETLGCPRVGIDEEATRWASNYYHEIVDSEGGTARNFRDKYPSLADYLDASHGKYVAELAKKKKGLGAITGIAVGSESFRGKILRYIEWLDEDLKNQAYEDHEPEELLLYGKALSDAAKNATKEGIGLEEEIKDLKSAASWCKFWGEHGHGMHAWY